MIKVVLLIAGVAGLYLAGLALLYTAQRSLIYPAPRQPQPAADALDGFVEVKLRTADGLMLRALHRPAADGRPTVLFFHGNGDSLAGAELATRLLGAAGYGLLLAEYRGYGGNPGAPSEAGLYADGRAALDWLQGAGVAPAQVVLVGNSLGSGVAVQLAAEAPVGGLAIVSGFTSLPDVAAQHMRLFPVRSLLRDRYDNAAKLGRVRASTLLLHGMSDTLIPPSHAQALARVAPRATLRLVPAAGHELAYLPAGQAALLEWLAATNDSD